MELPPLLVELGFGTGRDTRDLLNLEWQVTTVDPSETAEALCRDQYDYELESNMLSFKKATIEEFEFPNDVGVIFSNDTLPYCAPEKFPAALKKMHEALASGGKLMGNFFGEGENPESATAKRAMYKAFFIATGDGQSKRTKDQIIQDEKATVNQLLCDAGFQDVKIFHTTNRDNLSSIRFVATKSS
jgi:trans-aconitate methyltransferase